MTVDASKFVSPVNTDQFRFRLVQENFDQGVVLVCLVCNEEVYGEHMSGGGIGESTGGAESDDDLSTVIFQADEHQAMYCRGTKA